MGSRVTSIPSVDSLSIVRKLSSSSSSISLLFRFFNLVDASEGVAGKVDARISVRRRWRCTTFFAASTPTFTVASETC